MAYYAALTSLLQTLHQIPQPHRHQQIISLQEMVSRLLVIIEDSPPGSSLTIKDLEGRIREASYEAEDIIQSHISRQVLSKSPSPGVSSFPRKMIRLVKYMLQNVDLEFQGLEKIIEEFDSILDDLSNKIKDGNGEDLQPGNFLSVGSSRLVAGDKSTSVGLDEDLLQMKDRLTGSQSKLDIISIVGMGGIGKTTLARNLYHDSLIEYYFHIRAWTAVSQAYNVQEMLLNLLNSIRRGGGGGGGGGELQHKCIGELAELLYKSLKGWRYLIMMDDVWDTQVWDEVRMYFPDDNNGSRIILTTRLSEVAIYANSCSPIHSMSLLSAEASWNLLREKVFQNECCPSELEKIGKKIAKNCKGLPLAIVVISGLLCKGSKTREYWEYIAKNVPSAIIGNDDQVMKILSLSYDSLPHHLKPCFLYIGVFHEDRVISVSKLIRLWVAEGFIKPSPPKSLEEVAEDYLNDLIDRSLIMVYNRNHNGGAKAFVIHDLWRELCVKKAQDEEFLQIIDSDHCNFTQGGNNQRRVSIHTHNFIGIPDFHDSHVHTLLYFCRGFRTHVSRKLAHKLLSKSCRLLRVLDALTISFDEFPTEILELIHLRYLGLQCTYNNKFPASISKLLHLQTLIVDQTEWWNTVYLPSSIWEMPQLRHVLMDKGFWPTKMKGKNYVVLDNLQTLSGVVNLRCGKEVLEMMSNLKKLGISYICEANTEWSTFEFNNFVHLHQLERLKCRFVDVRRGNPVPVNFACPANLKRLTLSGCKFSWETMTVFGSLPNLEVLKLKDHAFVGPVWEPNEGEFSTLKFLLIDTSHLCRWRAKDIHFPRLQHLSLRDCPSLAEIPCEIGEIPTLEMLELCDCRPSAVASAKLIQEEQQDLENNTLRVVCRRLGRIL